MATATLLPDGMYSLDFGDGQPYRVPYEQALEAAPESFLETQEAPGYAEAMGYPEQGSYAPESPPWETGVPVPPGPETAVPGAEMPPWATPTEPEPEFTGEGFGPTLDQPGLDAGRLEGSGPMGWLSGTEDAPSAGLPGARSRGFSASVSGTGPYREAPPVDPSQPPSFAAERAQAARGAAAKRAAQATGILATQEYQDRLDPIYEDIAEHRRETVATQHRVHQEVMDEVGRREAEIEQARARISKMDPKKIWRGNDMKLAGFLSAGIAGFLNPTGKNSAIEHMMALTEQEARTQAANIATQKEAVLGMERGLGRFEDRMKDSEQRYLESRQMLLANMKDMVLREQSKYQSAITIAKFGEMLGEIDREEAATSMQWRQQEYSNVFQDKKHRDEMEQRAADRRQRAAQFRKSMSMRERELEAKRAGQMAKVDRGKFIGYFGGKALYAGPDATNVSDTEMGKIRDSIKTENLVNGHMQDMQMLLEGSKGRKITPNERAEVKAIASRIYRALRGESGANFTQMEKELTDDFFGNPNAILRSPDKVRELIDGALRNTPTRINNQLRHLGPRWHEGDVVVTDPETGEQFAQPQYGEWDPAESPDPTLGPVSAAERQEQQVGVHVEELESAKKAHAEAVAAGETAEAEAMREQVAIKASRLMTSIERWRLDPLETPELAERGKAALEGVSEITGVGTGGFFDPVRSAESLMERQAMKADKDAVIEDYLSRNPSIRAAGLAADVGDAPFGADELADWVTRNPEKSGRFRH